MNDGIKMKQGVFITFEGIEGCGKSTQAKRLGKTLDRMGIAHVMTLEPGGTAIGRHVRRVLLDSRNKALTPLSELMLYAADRAQHVEEIIKPTLRSGKWVICDRFSDATVVYQGVARGQDKKLIRLLNNHRHSGNPASSDFSFGLPGRGGSQESFGEEHERAGPL